MNMCVKVDASVGDLVLVCTTTYLDAEIGWCWELGRLDKNIVMGIGKY